MSVLLLADTMMGACALTSLPSIVKSVCFQVAIFLYLIQNSPEFNLFFSTSNGQTVALSNGSYATAISASDGSNIEGESFKFIILQSTTQPIGIRYISINFYEWFIN